MRILSGKFKNLLLKTPSGNKTRPTSSKMRGSVFDILQNQIEGASFLDLFAGSGAMGIEALSRGARLATFVEKDLQANRCIKENLKTANVEAHHIKNDVSKALRILKKQGEKFDIIYIDPPYNLDCHPILEEIGDLLTAEGLILLEQSKHTKIETHKLNQIDKRKFGDTILYFFRQPI